MGKVIYDFGANNGDDIPYYMMKSDLVVAIEANPVLCSLLEKRFCLEINNGKLVVENCVITAEESDRRSDFYIHKTQHVLSQFPRPSNDALECFEKTSLPSRSVAEIFAHYGKPYYVKIDIEHYDVEILKALSKARILPSYISAESHSVDVFCALVGMGYSSFKIVDGRTVSDVYWEREFQGMNGVFSYSFPYHSAGPFGNDIDGDWMSAKEFFRLLAVEGLGWKDIHASAGDLADKNVSSSLLYLKYSRMTSLWFFRWRGKVIRKFRRFRGIVSSLSYATRKW